MDNSKISIKKTIEIDNSVFGLTMLEKCKVIKNYKEINSYSVNWGKYWDDFEDSFSIGVNIIIDLICQERIKGTTYIETLLSENSIPSYRMQQDSCKDLIYEFISINNTNLEKVKEAYLEWIDKDEAKKYDNIVCVVRDNPKYTHSEKDYVTTTVIFCSKENSFIVNIGYPMEKEYEIDSTNIAKKLTLCKK